MKEKYSPKANMELGNLISKCESELYLGFTSVEFSGITWLNKICGELSNLCRCLQKLLETNTNSDVIETILLCTSQIVCCIKYLEKALTIEINDGIVLTPTRQFFLDRVMWCLSRIKTISDPSSTTADANFVHLMDVALELIAPLTLFASDLNTSNVAKHNAEASIASAKIRSVVDSLIGQVLAFVNVTLEEDKKPLTCMCQKVLRETMAFEESCSLLGEFPDEQNRRLKASTLETTFYQLDRWINDSLLKLVFAVFVELKTDPIQKLRELCENGGTQEEIEGQIQRIDDLFEKIVQIGHFALSFSWDYKTKSTLRSSLASLESLDSFLIPAILSHSGIHSKLLQTHWNDEIGVLINSIQNIIDTEAYCTCMIDILSTAINKLSHSFDKDLINNLLLHCDVLNDHFKTNLTELALETEPARSLHFDNFLLMIKECKAALALCDKDETNRVIKRLKILLSVLKKFHDTLQAPDDMKNDKVGAPPEIAPPEKAPPEKAPPEIAPPEIAPPEKAPPVTATPPLNMKLAKTENMEILKEETATTNLFFESMGITPSPTKKVLYESKREKSSAQKGLSRDSTFKIQRNEKEMPFTPSLQLKKRSSLRVALFKRSAENEARNLDDTCNNDTLGLHITDILEQISGLSNTLSNSHLHLKENLV